MRPGAQMLTEAARIIDERGKAYGHPTPNHIRIARFWDACLADKLAEGQKISPDDVVRCMIGLKLARLMETPDHVDSIQDIAGYAACLLEITVD